jgi:hypothetical protein
MRIPLPGGTIRVVFSPPLTVSPGLDGKAREETAGILEGKLKECDRTAAGA